MLGPTAVIATPWIETRDQWRQKARTWTEAYWTGLGQEVVYGTASKLNRAAARNDAARRTNAEVLFFCDADMWVPVAQFEKAVHLAEVTRGMVLAYDRHTRLSKWATQKLYDTGDLTVQGQTVRDTSGGCFAVHRELHDLIGGHDERFQVWGYEDRSFMFACSVLGSLHRVEGVSYHLWHSRDPVLSRHTKQRDEGRDLGKRYKKAAGVKARSGILGATKDAEADRDQMVRILAEPGGPLSECVGSSRE